MRIAGNWRSGLQIYLPIVARYAASDAANDWREENGTKNADKASCGPAPRLVHIYTAGLAKRRWLPRSTLHYHRVHGRGLRDDRLLDDGRLNGSGCWRHHLDLLPSFHSIWYRNIHFLTVGSNHLHNGAWSGSFWYRHRHRSHSNRNKWGVVVYSCSVLLGPVNHLRICAVTLRV